MFILNDKMDRESISQFLQELAQRGVLKKRYQVPRSPLPQGVFFSVQQEEEGTLKMLDVAFSSTNGYVHWLVEGVADVIERAVMNYLQTNEKVIEVKQFMKEALSN